MSAAGYTLIYRAGSGEMRGVYLSARSVADAQRKARRWAALHGGTVVLLQRGIVVVPLGVCMDQGAPS